MAIDYTKLFSDIGTFIKAVDQLRDTAVGSASPKPDLLALRDNILDTMNTNNTDYSVEGINALFENISGGMSSYASSVAQKVSERLSDRISVRNQLFVGEDADVAGILYELIRDMKANSQTVNKSVLTVGSPAAVAGNTGTGTVLLTKVLDGAAAPSPGLTAHPDYKNVDSELSVPSELVSVTCIGDSDQNAYPTGEELMEIRGQDSPSGPFGYQSEGSGITTNLRTDNAHAVLANRNFEVYDSTGAPESWDIIAGTLGVDFFANYDTANVFRGNASLEIAGPADITLHQDILKQLLIPNRMYRLSFQLKATGNTTGSVIVELYSPTNPSLFSGTTITVSSITNGSFTTHTTASAMPANLPDDIVLRIRTSSADGTLWIDSMSLAPVTYAAGVGYSVLAGATAFSVGDRFTMTHTATEGVVQRFFRRMYGIQLPSDASPSILDSVAT